MMNGIKHIASEPFSTKECEQLLTRLCKEIYTFVYKTCKIIVSLYQHAYPASRKNSALRVGFLFLTP